MRENLIMVNDLLTQNLLFYQRSFIPQGDKPVISKFWGRELD